MKLRTMLVLALALALTGSAAAGAFAPAKKKVVVHASLGAEPPSLDPGLATDTVSASIVQNIMEPILVLGPPPVSAPQPGLAASWQMQGTHVTLHLRGDVRWTNGKPVTARDVVDSWLRTISPQLGADYAYEFFGIAGAAAYNACNPAKADCTALRAKVGVSAPDSRTVRITLTSPQPWFLQQLSHVAFTPVYLPAVEKYGAKWTEAATIVTDGPFRLAAWKHDASLTLVKNPTWFDARSVHVDELDLSVLGDPGTALNAYRSGATQIDLSGFNATDIPTLRKTSEWHSFPILATRFYGFNVKNIPDVNQRRAMSAAIDRHAIVTYVTRANEQPARSFTPPAMPDGTTIDAGAWLPVGGDDTPSGLARAKALMAKVAKPVLDVNLDVFQGANNVQLAQAVQANWQKLGITTTIKALEPKQFLTLLGPPPDSSIDVFHLGWAADYPDAYNFLSLWTCKSGNNTTGWCDPQYDALIARAVRTPDTEERVALYRQAEDLLTGPNGQMPIAPIYGVTENALEKPNVHGLYVDPMDIYDFRGLSVS